MPAVTLSGRAHISITGGDAEDFLQGLITTDIPSLPAGEARAGALLTPQGKMSTPTPCCWPNSWAT